MPRLPSWGEQRDPDRAQPSTRSGDRCPVIVGYSGTDESHDALALTRELARLMRSRVVAVSVVTRPRWRPTSAPTRPRCESRPSACALIEGGARRPGRGRAGGSSGAEPSARTRSDRCRARSRPGRPRFHPSGPDPTGRARYGGGPDARRRLASGAIAPRGFSRTEFTLDTIGVGFAGHRNLASRWRRPLRWPACLGHRSS